MHWNAATGNSGGFQDWNVDLTPFAGKQVELSITYAPTRPDGLGVFVDDVKITTRRHARSRPRSRTASAPSPPVRRRPARGRDAATGARDEARLPGRPRRAHAALGLLGLRPGGRTGADKRAALVGEALEQLGVTATPPPPAYSVAVLARTPTHRRLRRMGKASGTTMVDASPKHNNGTYLNGVALGKLGAISGAIRTPRRRSTASTTVLACLTRRER